MLNIQIDNPELENNIRKTYGNDLNSIAGAFSEFILQQKIKQDIGVSIQQLEKGEAEPLEQVMRCIRAEYE